MAEVNNEKKVNNPIDTIQELNIELVEPLPMIEAIMGGEERKAMLTASIYNGINGLPSRIKAVVDNIQVSLEEEGFQTSDEIFEFFVVDTSQEIKQSKEGNALRISKEASNRFLRQYGTIVNETEIGGNNLEKRREVDPLVEEAETFSDYVMGNVQGMVDRDEENAKFINPLYSNDTDEAPNIEVPVSEAMSEPEGQEPMPEPEPTPEQANNQQVTAQQLDEIVNQISQLNQAINETRESIKDEIGSAARKMGNELKQEINGAAKITVKGIAGMVNSMTSHQNSDDIAKDNVQPGNQNVLQFPQTNKNKDLEEAA